MRTILHIHTSKINILQYYRDGIKSKETRVGWGEAHNVRKACMGITEGFKACAHHTSPTLPHYSHSLCS